MTSGFEWLSPLVAQFAATCKAKLDGPGEREASIRSPIEALLSGAGQAVGVTAAFHDEVRDKERRVRPDYGVSVAGMITGYVEVKAPARPIDPEMFKGHDRLQWERQRDLPNLLYTNGTDWRLYRDGELRMPPVELDGDLEMGKVNPVPQLAELLIDFLGWVPAPIKSVSALVRAIAPLTRLLRGEVLDQLKLERVAVRGGADTHLQPFLGLARDWRALLFPNASDDVFADGYAQTVTFALLLARTDGLELDGPTLHQVGEKIRAEHSLMGRALQLLTNDLVDSFKVTLGLLTRVINAVNWPAVRGGNRDTFLHLYEHFLDLYDPALRKASGSYYTPHQLVDEMVRLTEEVLVNRLGQERGFASPDVLTIDPAMGTGTYLHTILERAARTIEGIDGPGAVAGALTQAAERMIGFEVQMGPYAVAELRAAELLALHKAATPPNGMHFYVTDTLDDPHATVTQLGSGLSFIADFRKRANKIKATANVTVVIGNPPYAELANDLGGWVEKGSSSQASKKGAPAILDAWYAAGAGRFKAKLKNLYIYFWRWATWKVWESTPQPPDGDAGVVCFVSTSGYLTGPAFTAMREYLRRYASEGWIIDLTPEGQTPDVPTRIFPGVRQPLAIGLFVRKPDADPDVPARIHHATVSGRQADKFAALAQLGIDGSGWRPCRTDWTAPLTPAAMSRWDDYPALSDVLPWYSPGVFPTRTWVYAPSKSILAERWSTLVGEEDSTKKAKLFKEGQDANLQNAKLALPGPDTYDGTTLPVAADVSRGAEPVRIGYRAFDRQWLLPDSRLIDRPRRDLWSARVPGQVYVIEQHRKALQSGPGIVVSALLPDFDHFKGSEGGRALPMLHPDGSANIAPGLIDGLVSLLVVEVTPADVMAYIAALVAHPAYTATFTDELTTPGIRIPISRDPALWNTAVDLGAEILWTQTYGAAFASPERPENKLRYPIGDPRQPLSQAPVLGLPETISYVADAQTLHVGTGQFGPVAPGVWEYAVGGKNVLKFWFNYRKKNPGGRVGSPLDEINAPTWDPDWTAELIDLLTVLTRLTVLEERQAELLAQVLAGDLVSMVELAAAGTHWPQNAADRAPRHSLASSYAEGQLELPEG